MVATAANVTDLTSYRDGKTGDVYVFEAPKIIPQVEQPQLSHFVNLAQYMNPTALQRVGDFVAERVQEDKDSRSEWEKQVERAFELLGVGPEAKPDDTEYENSDTSNHVLLTKAMVRFLSNSQAEMLPADRICRCDPAIDVPPAEEGQQQERQDALLQLEGSCNRAEDFFTHYCMERLPTYVEDHDRTLFDTGLAGVGFKKIYIDRTNADPVQVEMIPAEKLIIAYNAKSMRLGRITHEIDMTATELVRRMEMGVYVSVPLSPTANNPNPVTEARDKIQGIEDSGLNMRDTYMVWECHLELMLPIDPHPMGLARPYVVTIDAESKRVLGIYRNWMQGDAAERRQEAFVGYQIHPGKSAVYGWGLGTILNNITQALRTGQRRALEAAYLQNHPAGFKKKDLVIREDNKHIVPGELVDIDSPAERISDAIYLFDYKGPSQGLIALMTMMKEDGEQLAGLSAQDLGKLLTKDTPVGSMLAVLEEATRFEGAIHRRLYRGQKTEYEIIHARMIQVFDDQDQIYSAGRVLKRGDLSKVQIMPAMQPGQASRQRRILESQALAETAEANPDIVDQRKAVINYLKQLGLDNLTDFLMPPPEEAQPADAVTEYNKALQGTPLKAGVTQNHQAHIQAHLASMQSIMNSDLPVDVGQRAVTNLAAHVAEHMALYVSTRVAAITGIPLEQLSQGLPPEIENEVAPMIAEAIQQIEAERQAAEGPSPEEVRLQVERLRGQNVLASIDRKGQYDLRKQAMGDAADTEQNDADNITAIELQAMKLAGQRAKDQTAANVAVGVSTGAPSNDSNPGRR